MRSLRPGPLVVRRRWQGRSHRRHRRLTHSGRFEKSVTGQPHPWRLSPDHQPSRRPKFRCPRSRAQRTHP